jgi:hypothetical protein
MFVTDDGCSNVDCRNFPNLFVSTFSNANPFPIPNLPNPIQENVAEFNLFPHTPSFNQSS